jgi:hypothetical protein
LDCIQAVVLTAIGMRRVSTASDSADRHRPIDL